MRSRLRALICSCLLAACVAAIALYPRTGRPLFEVATRLPESNPDWEGTYEWLPDGRELGVEENGRVGCKRAFLVDQHTGAQIPRPGLTRLLQAAGGDLEWRVRPSPDGKLLLAVGNSSIGECPWTLIVCLTDEPVSHVRERAILLQRSGIGRAQAAWLPDSRRVLCFSQRDAAVRATIFDAVEGTGSEMAVPVPAASTDLLGVDASGRMVTADRWDYGPDTRQLAIHVSPVAPGTGESRTSTVDLPPGHRISVPFALSPRGDRIAWVLERETPIPDVKRLRLWFRDRGTPLGRTLISVWVSGIDGCDMRELGEYDLWDRYYLSNLRWLPDGRSITFASDVGVWRVAAN